QRDGQHPADHPPQLPPGTPVRVRLPSPGGTLERTRLNTASTTRNGATPRAGPPPAIRPHLPLTSSPAVSPPANPGIPTGSTGREHTPVGVPGIPSPPTVLSTG